ncbi:MAG: hypothetical protein Edafosvirus5_10 [Edafosvirus sp.]|uniref:Uncharacterized protein n=1 Tax=Edafosvirus sp. TaxID=2487765 RepID=A0A3G4ZT69_9VIRU|nr:MAG: hypothetical protein Edafosvirus5_10 [Edafosvirus sp.]
MLKQSLNTFEHTLNYLSSNDVENLSEVSVTAYKNTRSTINKQWNKIISNIPEISFDNKQGKIVGNYSMKLYLR